MKKLFAIFLAFTLILALAGCGKTDAPAEPEDAATPGTTAEPEATEDPSTPAQSAVDQDDTPEVTVETWYGLSLGLPVTLALSSDGTYTLSLAGEDRSGAWAEADGGIVLDGEETAPLYQVSDTLLWQGMGIFLTAEPPEAGAYAPAELVKDGVTAETFNGYWQSAYVDADGAILSAHELDDKTDVYIEAPRAALGGPLFGDVAVDMAFVDGALTWSEGGVSVKMELQSDGLLRMTLAAPDSGMTLYLLPTYVEGLSPEPTEG